MELEIIHPTHINLKYKAKINVLKKKYTLKDGTLRNYYFYVVSIPEDVFNVLGRPSAVDFGVRRSEIVISAGTEYTVKKRGNNVSVPKKFFNVKKPYMTFTVEVLYGVVRVLVDTV